MTKLDTLFIEDLIEDYHPLKDGFRGILRFSKKIVVYGNTEVIGTYSYDSLAFMAKEYALKRGYVIRSKLVKKKSLKKEAIAKVRYEKGDTYTRTAETEQEAILIVAENIYYKLLDTGFFYVTPSASIE